MHRDTCPRASTNGSKITARVKSVPASKSSRLARGAPARTRVARRPCCRERSRQSLLHGASSRRAMLAHDKRSTTPPADCRSTRARLEKVRAPHSGFGRDRPHRRSRRMLGAKRSILLSSRPQPPGVRECRARSGGDRGRRPRPRPFRTPRGRSTAPP